MFCFSELATYTASSSVKASEPPTTCRAFSVSSSASSSLGDVHNNKVETCVVCKLDPIRYNGSPLSAAAVFFSFGALESASESPHAPTHSEITSQVHSPVRFMTHTLLLRSQISAVVL